MSIISSAWSYSDGDTNSSILQTMVGQYNSEGAITHEETMELLKQLDECQHHSSACWSAPQQPLVQILRQKARYLRIELEVARRTDPHTLPDNSQVIEKQALADLQRQVSQVKETLSLVDIQQHKLQASIQQEEQDKEQLLAVCENLQEKADNLDGENPSQDAVEAVTQELGRKIDAAARTEEAMMKRLADFVEKHFPFPEPAQVAKISTELRSRKQQNTKETLFLKDILLELMTKCVESPTDPYLVLDERHWPAYIELLLRCNIILQHSDDDRRIKLVPFHL